MKIRTGDTVLVISGDDKGKTGKVLKALPKENKVIVEGVNVNKKHVKPSQANPKGSIKEINLPIDVSNVAFVDPKTNKATKVGYTEVDGKKVRVAKKSGEIIK
ncbi:MAG: 50S ribosomal protein L24 [Bacilli bacterium]|jgi:large subunit ribosomal protein L24|nr:50S ribosomal protein L24 [Bacilli bacterium]